MFKSPNMFRLDPNDHWKRQRHLSSTAFSDNNLKHEFETNIDKVTNDLINFWDKFADKDEFIDASEGKLLQFLSEIYFFRFWFFDT